MDKVLKYSDKVVTGDLLRFDKRTDFAKVDKSKITYKVDTGLSNLKRNQTTNPSSVFAKNGNKSKVNDYKTDAPELTDDK
ncbi:hypothetical protein [Neobacillus sp.]|uniref:hypothetical protein n=1 Tax=Neobacillus sp. TaxID=2675273 RepID=UPI0028A02959|nr:hypothetical protein [Neobacillus sp.]